MTGSTEHQVKCVIGFTDDKKLLQKELECRLHKAEAKAKQKAQQGLPEARDMSAERTTALRDDILNLDGTTPHASIESTKVFTGESPGNEEESQEENREGNCRGMTKA